MSTDLLREFSRVGQAPGADTTLYPADRASAELRQWGIGRVRRSVRAVSSVVEAGRYPARLAV